MRSMTRVTAMGIWFAVGLGIAIPAGAQNTEPSTTVRPAFEIAPEAYIQLDWRDYRQSAVAPGTGRLE